MSSTEIVGQWQPTQRIIEDWGRPRVLINGKDVTFYRGVPTLVRSWSTVEPFGFAACVIHFPQITSHDRLLFRRENGRELEWFNDFREVVLHRVRPDGTVDQTPLFLGLLADYDDVLDTESDGYDIQAVGLLYSADWTLKKPSFWRDARDIGHVIAEELNAVISKRYADVRAVNTGIMTRKKGGFEPLLTGYVQDLLGTATTDDHSNQWTVNLDLHASGKVPTIRLKDRTTEHWVVRLGTPGITHRLTRDLTQRPNVIYGEGVDPDMCRWRNTKYPNLRLDDAPVYPHAAQTVFFAGGGLPGFQPAADRMRENGYAMVSGDTYAAADETRVRTLQREGGILVDGIVGPQTWAVIFDVGANAGDLSGAFFMPLYYLSWVEPHLYASNGAIIGSNAEPEGTWDFRTPRQERYNNYGEGITKREAARSARAEIRSQVEPHIDVNGDGPGWIGSITFQSDPENGSRFDIKAGQNILYKGFHRNVRGAETMFHIAAAEVDLDALQVTCTVDTNARDLLTVASIQQRNRENTDPVRRTTSVRRQSRMTPDARAVWDCENGAGVVPRHALYRGLWTVIRIPAGSAGTIVDAVFRVDSPKTPFAVGVFGKQIHANDLARLVGNPLSGNKPWAANAEALEDRGILWASGGPNQAMGYYPGAESDGDALTGVGRDPGSWEWVSDFPPWLWVAEYAPVSCFIRGQLFNGVET